MADRRVGSRSTKVGLGAGESRERERERELASSEKSLPPTLSCFTVLLLPPPPPATVPIIGSSGCYWLLLVAVALSDGATTFLQTGEWIRSVRPTRRVLRSCCPTHKPTMGKNDGKENNLSHFLILRAMFQIQNRHR